MFDADAEPFHRRPDNSQQQRAGFGISLQQRTECPADRAMNLRLFADLFNALAAARRRWKDKPNAPRKVEDHCDLAKAIDRYHADHSDCSQTPSATPAIFPFFTRSTDLSYIRHLRSSSKPLMNESSTVGTQCRTFRSERCNGHGWRLASFFYTHTPDYFSIV